VGADRDAAALSLHDLWREELLKKLLPASRKLLHHRCGLVLEGECRLTRSPAMVWEAAQHLLASGSEGRALSLLEESAQHQLDNGLPTDAANSFDLAFQASSTDVDRLRALSGRIAALKRATDWTQISTLVGTARELCGRSSLQTSPHSDLELLEIESLWRTETDLKQGLDRALSCALDLSASTSHRAAAALIGAIAADNASRFADLTMLNEIASKLLAATTDARSHILSVRIIYETTLGSLEQAQEAATQLVGLEREAGSVRGLARALRFSCYPSRLLGRFDEALGAVNEALELAERHHLVGEAASAADVILSIHLEREDLVAANAWLARLKVLAPRVGVRYAQVGLAFNEAILALASGDHSSAMKCIESFESDYLNDPMVRKRMLFLSILVRILLIRGDRDRLFEVEPSLRDALEVRRSTASHDFHVASYALTLEALGMRDTAVAYVTDFVRNVRRDRTHPSTELSRFLRDASDKSSVQPSSQRSSLR
jgi:tetratricopeptide (TPR) repeat protein